MSEFGLTFHHLGLALKNEEDAILFLKGQGYDCGDLIYDSEQNVHLRLCKSKNAPWVKLILPGVGEGPLTPILKKYNELVYHTCFETGDRDASLRAMEEAGLRLMSVSPPEPRHPLQRAKGILLQRGRVRVDRIARAETETVRVCIFNSG